MSKFVCSAREITSISQLMITTINNLPFAKCHSDGLKMIEKLRELKADAKNIATFTIDEFNIKYGLKDGALTVYMDKERQITMEVNEDYMIEVFETIEEEVPTLVGIGISIFGAMMMLKSRFVSLANRLDKMARKYKN